MMIQKFRWINERDITTTENQISLQNKINELVDAVNELERTRKALEIAVDALRTVRRYTAINQFAPKSREAHIVAKKAVAEITALEQKE